MKTNRTFGKRKKVEGKRGSWRMSMKRKWRNCKKRLRVKMKAQGS